MPNAASQEPAPAALAAAPSDINPASTSAAPAGMVTIAQAPTTPAVDLASLSSVEKKASDEVRSSLPGLRGQIELFGLMNSGQTPKLGDGENNGWTDLVNAQLVKVAPANSYVGGPNASKIVLGEKPDATFQSNYGWIFNPKTNQLWAAGFDAKDRPLSKSAATAVKPGAKFETAQPSKTDPATAGVETEGQVK